MGRCRVSGAARRYKERKTPCAACRGVPCRAEGEALRQAELNVGRGPLFPYGRSLCRGDAVSCRAKKTYRAFSPGEGRHEEKRLPEKSKASRGMAWGEKRGRLPEHVRGRRMFFCVPLWGRAYGCVAVRKNARSTGDGAMAAAGGEQGTERKGSRLMRSGSRGELPRPVRVCGKGRHFTLWDFQTCLTGWVSL